MKRTLAFFLMLSLVLSMATAIVVPVTAATQLNNLWNFASEQNCVVNANTGVFQAYGGNYYTSTNFISVNTGDVLTFGYGMQDQGYHLALYDANGTYIKNVKDAGLTYTAYSDGAGYGIYSYTVESGVGNIRISVHKSYAEKFIATLNQPFTAADHAEYWTAQDSGSFDDSQVDSESPIQNLFYRHKEVSYETGVYTTASYTVAAGDVFYYGPVNSTYYQPLFTPTGASEAVTVSDSQLMIKDTLDAPNSSGVTHYIYAFKADAAGTVRFRVPLYYIDYYTVAKNQELTEARYFEELETREDLYNVALFHLDRQGAIIQPNGTYLENAAYSSTHIITLDADETLYFGPINKTQASYGIANGASLALSDFTLVDALNDSYGFYTYTASADDTYLQLVYPSALGRSFFAGKGDSDIEDHRDSSFWDYYLTENLYVKNAASQSIALAAGNIVAFGPVAPDATDLLIIDGKTVTKADCAVSDVLPDGSLLMAYTATAACTITDAENSGYETFFIGKNVALTQHNFYQYWDHLGTNLWGETGYIGQKATLDGMVADASFNATHRALVNHGEVVTFGPVAKDLGLYGVVYDAEGAPAKGIYYSNLTPVEGKEGYYSYAIPMDIYYIQLNLAAENAETYSASYVRDMKGILSGKTALFSGDSICEAVRDGDSYGSTGYGWAGRIQTNYGTISTNTAVGGSYIGNETSTRYSINTLIEQVKDNDYEYVILEGGVNDMNGGRAVGKMSESFDVEDFDTSTFAGGLERVLHNAIEYFGDTAAIGYLFTFDTGTYCNSLTTEKDYTPYYEEAKKICEKWNIPFLNMFESRKINAALRMDSRIRGAGGYAYMHTDYLHPRAIGYERLTPYIANFMTTLEQFHYKHGDVNHDSTADLLDALLILRKLSGNLPEEIALDLQCANVIDTVEGENEVNSADVAYFLKVLTGAWKDGRPLALNQYKTTPTIVGG